MHQYDRGVSAGNRETREVIHNKIQQAMKEIIMVVESYEMEEAPILEVSGNELKDMKDELVAVVESIGN